MIAIVLPAEHHSAFVEVKGSWDGTTFAATEIELDDEDYLDEEDDDVELRGILMSDGAGGYSVNGVPLAIEPDTDVDGTDLSVADVVGMFVEVEGHVQDGVLVVYEIGFEGSEIEVEGAFGGVTGSAKEGTATVWLDTTGSLSLNVISATSTMIHQDGTALNLADLNATVCPKLEIDARLDGLGAVIATTIECDDGPLAFALEGPVDSFEPGVSITVLGVTYQVDGSTTYSNTDANFTNVSVGGEVEIADADGDGLADSVTRGL